MKTPAERLAVILQQHTKGRHEPDGPLARDVLTMTRNLMNEQRRRCSEAVDALARRHPEIDRAALYAAYSAVLETPIVGETK